MPGFVLGFMFILCSLDISFLMLIYVHYYVRCYVRFYVHFMVFECKGPNIGLCSFYVCMGTFIEYEDLNVQKTRHPNINPNIH